MLSSIFIAKASEVTNDTDSQEHPNVDIKPVETVRLEALAKLVKASAGELDPLDTSGEQFVIPVGEKLAAKLAGLDAKTIKKTASAWAKSDAWEPEMPEEAAVQVVLAEMCALAAQAKRETKRLYLWLSL